MLARFSHEIKEGNQDYFVLIKYYRWYSLSSYTDPWICYIGIYYLCYNLVHSLATTVARIMNMSLCKIIPCHHWRCHVQQIKLPLFQKVVAVEKNRKGKYAWDKLNMQAMAPPQFCLKVVCRKWLGGGGVFLEAYSTYRKKSLMSILVIRIWIPKIINGKHSPLDSVPLISYPNTLWSQLNKWLSAVLLFQSCLMSFSFSQLTLWTRK